jgi:hypothetical protein
MCVPDARLSEVLVLSCQYEPAALPQKSKVHSRLEVFTMCVGKGVSVGISKSYPRAQVILACWPSSQCSASSTVVLIRPGINRKERRGCGVRGGRRAPGIGLALTGF